MTMLEMDPNEYFHLVFDYPANKKNFSIKFFCGMTFKSEFKTTYIKKANDLLKPILQGLKSINHILLIPEFHKDKTVHYHGWLDIKNWKKWQNEEKYLFEKLGSLHCEKPKDINSCNEYITKDIDETMWGARSLDLLEKHHSILINAES